MNQTPIGERLQNIEDEIALVDSTIDAKTLKLWQAFDILKAQVDDLRNLVEGGAKV